MRKFLSIIAVVGVLTVTSVFALADERPAMPNDKESQTKTENFVTELGDGVSAEDVVKDVIITNDEKAVDELGKGASKEDMAKDVHE